MSRWEKVLDKKEKKQEPEERRSSRKYNSIYSIAKHPDGLTSEIALGQSSCFVLDFGKKRRFTCVCTRKSEIKITSILLFEYFCFKFSQL